MPDLRVPYDAKVTVDHDSPEPLYRQVAALLRGRITSGEFTGRLPSLKTIAQEYGVSHITAEKAMDLLKERGPGGAGGRTRSLREEGLDEEVRTAVRTFGVLTSVIDIPGAPWYRSRHQCAGPRA